MYKRLYKIKGREEQKMNKYMQNLSPTIKSYFHILSSEFPEFLYEYIDTPEMQKQGGISVSCGTIYSKLFNRFWYSSLDHSVAVALIIWNFTKDKKQTLAGLFHDIATPVFKHCIDFMNGDYEKQESTEELTTQIIEKSKEIMKLLNRDHIKIEEVSDYHIYPIADNDTPKLSSDRLEYTLSNGLGAVENLWDLETVKEIYQDIEIQENEEGIPELGFKHKELAEKFVNNMSKLSCIYISNKTKFSMQLMADIVKKMYEQHLVSKKDLYTLSEKEIIQKIENCPIKKLSNCFKKWEYATQIKESDELPHDKYAVNIKVKQRYIVPLVEEGNQFVRIDKISKNAKEDINRFLNYQPKKYAYLDFNL